MVNCQNCVQWPLSRSKMAAISRHSFNIGPMGKLFKSSPLKPVSQFKANMAWMVLVYYTFKIVSGDHDLHPRWLPWADIVLTYIVKPYGIWIVKLRCIRHVDILKRAYLCQVSDTDSPEPLVFIEDLTNIIPAKFGFSWPNSSTEYQIWKFMDGHTMDMKWWWPFVSGELH